MTDKKSDKKRILAIILMFVFFFGGSWISDRIVEQRKAEAAANAENEFPMTRDVYLLDTYCTLTINDGSKEALDAAVDALNKYDDLLNYSKEGSDIYKINNRISDSVPIDDDTAMLLQTGREFCELTGGVLEPAIRPVTDLWDFKDEKKVPEQAVIDAALKKVKSMQWDVVPMDAANADAAQSDAAKPDASKADAVQSDAVQSENKEEYHFEFVAYDSDVRIDVGSVAKGFIADRIKEVMLANCVTSGIINLGGNVLCIGSKTDGETFKVAVKDPYNEKGYSETLEVVDESVVTAGAYERCFEENGVRYHHIIDPSNGYPARTGLESVTINGPESLVCDALSTSIFIMGEEKGTEFLQKYNQDHGTSYRVYFLKEKNA